MLPHPQHITLAQRIPSDTWIGIGVGAHFL